VSAPREQGHENVPRVTLLICRRSGVPTLDCPSPNWACEYACDDHEVEYVRASDHEATVERLREALREIASSCTSVLHAEQVAHAALEASSEPRP
jgi:hypothetical protein